MSNHGLAAGKAAVERLPKWVQLLIERLERRVKDLESDVRELKWDNPDTDTFVEMYDQEDRPLPKGASIRFELGPERWNAVDVRVARDEKKGPYLHIMGLGMITLEPRSGNVVNIRGLP